MDVLISDTLVVTCDEARRMLERGAVAVRGNRIAAVGVTADLEREHPRLQRVSGRGFAVFPGFINAHTHTALTVLRGTIEDSDGDVIYGYMSPISYAMTAEERARVAHVGCV